MNHYETVELTRDTDAVLIPTGVQITLTQGTEVVIFQSLGESFTVNINGNLARIEGKDGDALGREPLEDVALIPSSDTPADKVDEKLIIQQFKTCFDPEIPVNIYDLGLIYDVQILPLGRSEHQVEVKMTLTAPGCGMGDILAAEIHTKVLKVPNVTQVNVELVFDPPWDRDRMSEEAKLVLGM